MGHSFFEIFFPDVEFNYSGDTQVCCPFPHKDENNMEYFETNPSAGIHLEKGVFHCFSCNRKFSEISFVAEILNTSYGNAIKILEIIRESESLVEWSTAVDALWSNQKAMTTLYKLGFDKKTPEELKIGFKGEGITFPIIMFGRVLDEVTYRPGQKPKYLRKLNSKSGLIYGYDLWKSNNKNTIICAGEKDATIARVYGLNAISFTGGEQTVPHLFLNEFKDRKVYIVYDNDQTGKTGSSKLAMHLKPIAKEVYVVDISSVCVEKGEDLWDYFKKYNKTRENFVELLKSTPIYTEEKRKEDLNKNFPLVTLHEATTGKYVNRILRSNIQVVAEMDSTYLLPVLISGTKTKYSDKESNNTMNIGETRHWGLNDWNQKDIFYLIDSNLKEKVIEAYKKTNLLKIPSKEDFIRIKNLEKKSVYKSVVTDLISSVDNSALTEFTCYSIGYKLEAGKQYLITYRLVPHPQDGQKLMMVVNDVEDTDDFLNNFKIDDQKIKSLKKFQVPEYTKLKDKFNELIQRVKGIINADYNDSLLTIIDLYFHSVLEFNVGKFKNIRGTLDTLIIGESRIGKSSTVEALQRVYKLGKIISLAGSSATVAGLIGGSNKVGGSFQTRAGVLPQNHRQAVILEELVRSNANVTKELIELRSSGKARITRVNGSVELPALVRMLTLTNPKSSKSGPKPISSYPNGIAVLTDVVGTAEDIARYDIIAIFGFDADKPIDPFFEPMEPYDDIDYQTRIRWVWSRKPDNIIITQKIYQYVTKRANELNKIYSSHIKLFGIEAWKKILRLAVAIAGYVCSADKTFENIIVGTEHIDLAIDILISLYDNETFRFKEYVKEERKVRETDPEAIKELQEIYSRNPILVKYLANTNTTTRSDLAMVSGTDNAMFNKITHSLVANSFIKIHGFDITPTERFRKTYKKIDRNVEIKKIDEVVLKI